MTDSFELMQQMKEKIAALPRGYISKKNRNGIIRHYRQWKENGKVKSEYIREEDLDEVTKQIEERKDLEARLKELQKKFPVSKDEHITFETNVKTGKELAQMVAGVKLLEKRDIYQWIPKYLQSDVKTRVCVIYGLRRTGKTTMLFQAIADMSQEDFAKTAYIKLRTKDIMNNVTRDLDKLWNLGYRYVFIDEVTLMEDFIDAAALFSDIYTMMGMKIVLSGTDSLGFWFARDNELYDRERTYHTTFIPYREHSRLLQTDSIDEYIRYGGTLRLGETNFDDEELSDEGVAFRDDESTRRYIDTAICKNIQHSLSCFEFGRNFGHLQDLYDAGELTGAINRIIEDMNHRFVVEVLTREFKSADLGLAARNLRNERETEKRTNILDAVETSEITKKLMQILEIKNKDEQTVDITPSHVSSIRKYLEALDLIVTCPTEYADGNTAKERVLFTQPGMRYCQAQALVYSLMQDRNFKEIGDAEKQYVTERILEEVRGRMLEDIVLLETSKALGKTYKIFKYQFERGEYDMVVRNAENDTCAVYEIKHSKEYVPEQGRHLMDEEKLELTSKRYGTLTGRYVLYMGENFDSEDGIAYRNVEQFLKNLPKIDMISGLEEGPSEDEKPTFEPVM